jgi:hypothetical protein
MPCSLGKGQGMSYISRIILLHKTARLMKGYIIETILKKDTNQSQESLINYLMEHKKNKQNNTNDKN